MIKQEDSFQKSQADTEEVSVTEEVKESNNEGEKNFSESDVIILEEDDKIVENFQPNELYYQIKIMKALEKDADYKLKSLKENDLVNRKLSIEKYIKALNRIFSKRKQIIELLGQGKKYHDSLYSKADIVATAYSNFSQRFKKVAAKLAEQHTKLSIRSLQASWPDILNVQNFTQPDFRWKNFTPKRA